MNHLQRQTEGLGDVGKALMDALVLRQDVLKPAEPTRKYMFGLWTRAAARVRGNKVLHREMLRRAEQYKD